jgi:hypothetical protein
VKGEPPKNAKWKEGTKETDGVDMSVVVPKKTVPAKLLYFAMHDPDIGEAISDEPLPLLGDQNVFPNKAVFESQGKKLVVNQNKLNVLRNRFPNAEYKASKTDPGTSAIVIYDKGEMVGLLMPINLKETGTSIFDVEKLREETKAEPKEKEAWEMSKEEYVDGHIKSPAMHQYAVQQALRSGVLTPARYAELHEKDYGKLEEFMPEMGEKAEIPPVPPKPQPSEAITEKAITALTEKDLNQIKRFRIFADNLQKQIDDKRREMTQNPTPKRMKEYHSRIHDANNLERTQQALRAMADAIEAGNLPKILVDIKTKDNIASLVRKGLEGGGYYDVIPSSEYADKSEKGIVLQNLLEKSLSGEQIEEQKKRAEAKKIKDLEETVRFSTIPGFFATPEPAIDTMLNLADIQRHNSLREILTAKGFNLIGDDFLEHKGQYDRIIQNPPFEKGQDIDHVRHAYNQLKPGGRLVSIISTGPFFRSDKKSISFREWFREVGGEEHELGQAFKGAKSFRQTGVSSKIIVIDKEERPAVEGEKSPVFLLSGDTTLGQSFTAPAKPVYPVKAIERIVPQ